MATNDQQRRDGRTTDLPARLDAIADLVQAENDRLKESTLAGFFPYDPRALARAVVKAVAHLGPGEASLDLGAGTGGWWLLVAATGIPSYAIEIHPELVAVCERLREVCVERKLIDPCIPCVIVQGDMIPPHQKERYRRFRQAHGEVERSMPGASDESNSYEALGISLNDFGAIYFWSWPTQSRFLFNMLAKESRDDALFILPSYVRYTLGEHMNASLRERNELLLRILAQEGDIVIGRQDRSAA